MRTLGGLCFALVLVSGLSAQSRGSVTPTVTGSSGSVVFPGGTPATSPGVTRGFGNVVNPGGGGPHLTVPGGVVPSFARPANGRPVHRTAPVATYAYPVYYGNYGGSYDGYAPEQGGGAGAGPQQQPNVTVVMPPPQPVTPVIINIGPGGGQYTTAPERQQGVYEPAYQTTPSPDVEEPASADEPQRYLIAFKDHTIYSAIAYWVDGDTLHYFTSGNTHNQVSVSLVDRALTQRLNKESGVPFKIPAK
ncbi:MAG TPA: hypothetical protein VKJ01_15585 [Candidatus Solibacter sp.]|jgi:hypothetical protein|nr:hypothetical protein [Candidatus Solibacter sp.]